MLCASGILAPRMFFELWTPGPDLVFERPRLRDNFIFWMLCWCSKEKLWPLRCLRDFYPPHYQVEMRLKDNVLLTNSSERGSLRSLRSLRGLPASGAEGLVGLLNLPISEDDIKTSSPRSLPRNRRRLPKTEDDQKIMPLFWKTNVCCSYCYFYCLSKVSGGRMF